MPADSCTGDATSHSAPDAGSFAAWGPRLLPEGVSYSIWAPEHSSVEVHVHAEGGRVVSLTRDSRGFHQGLDPQGKAGDRYQFRIGDDLLPDPAARAQAGDVHGPSLVVDARAFPWTDHAWRRPAFRDVVIYELHIGTFTPAGTFRAAIEKLGLLRDLGVTAIEIMPIADFPGSRSWGYDGVLIYAPARAYGSPDDFRALVDAAHAHGLAVILDVVYNHFGPAGNYLAKFSQHFFHPDRHTPWGAAFNFDGPSCAVVRDFFLQNPIYWMEDFHIDGFRFDATHEIQDESPRHILAEMAAAVHARGGYAIAEDSRNEADLLREPQEGGFGFDAVWADDFHHVTRVSQTGENEAYYAQYRGSLNELIQTLRTGWLYSGQPTLSTGEKRGTSADGLPPSKFLHCLSNHDQVGNRAFGERLHQSITPEAYRALSALLCLSPFTPMLFMGQEWAASTPFLYFTDHDPELGRLITIGRRREFAEFAAFRDPAVRARIPDPQAEATFLTSKLNWAELKNHPHHETYALYQAALSLRAVTPALRPKAATGFRASLLPWGVVAIRYDQENASFLLIVDLQGNHQGKLGMDPLTEPPAGTRWQCRLDSNESRFGGKLAAAFDETDQTCYFRAPTTLLLAAEPTGLPA